jgi:hypothetical protein
MKKCIAIIINNIMIINIIIGIGIMSCSRNNSNKTSKFEYHGLGMLIESYYRDYYEYPQNLNEFILFCDSIRNNAYAATINKLKENRNNIKWTIESSKILVTIENGIIYETELRSPCDELTYNRGMYLGKVLFFNTNGVSIHSEELEFEFKNHLKEIKMHYSKIDSVYNESKYHLLEYTPDIGLLPFCDDDKISKEFGFFKEIERFLKVYTNKHNLSKVIFVTSTF